MKVVIRTDASDRIGSGHVMRCLSLADALRGQGAFVSFVSRELPPHLARLTTQSGHGLVAIGTEAQDALADADFTAKAAEAADWIVVDHYGLGAEWEARAGRTSRVMAIDDIARPHACDLLLDQNYDPLGSARYAGLVADGTTVLVGPRFALLRPEFLAQRASRKPVQATVRNIVVFLGGMDQDNVTGHVLAALERVPLPDTEIDVIIGPSHPAREAIEALCRERPGYRCHVQVQNMAEFFAGADLVVGAGGTATWERCAVGTPTLGLGIADNQKDLLYHGSRLGLLYAPAIRHDDADAIACHVKALIENPGLRESLSRTSLEWVDGRGADRVAARLRGGLITMRRAEPADCDRLHAWRNDPIVRRFSTDPAEIPLEKHRVWFNRILSDTRHDLLIGELEGRPVGVVRFDLDAPLALVSIYLVPNMLGKGLGSNLLQAGEVWLRNQHPAIAAIRADVRSDNHASHTLFEAASYIPQSTSYFKDLRS